MTNSLGSVLSNQVTLTVTALAPPVITTQPVGETVAQGSPASFTVVATGGGTLSYQWYQNGSPVGTNSATYSIPSTQPGNAGTYMVTVSNAGGSTPSNQVSLVVVIPPPVITTQPVSETVAQGSPASFTVVATGGGTLSYQWSQNGSPVGTNSATYSIPSAQPSDAGTYQVTVSNAGGSTPSNQATLLVVQAPVMITTQPSSQSAVAGSNVIFTVDCDRHRQYLSVVSRQCGHQRCNQ